MERFLRYNQICDEKLPLMKFRKNKPKSEIWDKPDFRNPIHTPTHLVCHTYLIANFLSFHMSLVVVNFGAGNALHGLEISTF